MDATAKIGKRIKLARNTLELNQSEFGGKIGLTNAAISMIENGDRGLTEQSIISLCREYRINESWLRSGKGDMFAEEFDNDLEYLAQTRGIGFHVKEMLRLYMDLDSKSKRAVEDFFENFVGHMRHAEPPKPSSPKASKPTGPPQMLMDDSGNQVTLDAAGQRRGDCN